MKAAYIEKTGSPEDIQFGNLPKPKPVDDQVLVKVKAVAVNPVDTYIRSGAYEENLPMPFVIGCDLAGVVESTGPDVKRYNKGDRVWGSNQGVRGRQGTFAEYAAVSECWLYPTPEEVSDQDAAAVALVGLTAHLGLFRDAQLKAGEKVFVNGGTGGVGSCVIQMGRAIGAKVMATAGSDERVGICRQLGAALAVNYKTGDLDASLRKFGPIDVWFETQREQNFDRILEHMAPRGRVVVIAGRKSRSPLPVGPLYSKDVKLLGMTIFNATIDEQRKSAAEINRWLARERLRPRIDRVMSLSEAAAAHRLQEDSSVKGTRALAGKIVLIP